MSYRIKLIKGMSYTGNGIEATKKSPEVTVEDKATAQKAVASGYFTLVGKTEETASDTADDTTAGAEDGAQEESGEIAVENMTLAQLKAVATQMGISTAGLKKRSDYITAIEAAEDAADAAADSTGSPTMIKLQEE